MALSVTGIEEDIYYINNDIIVELEETNGANYFSLAIAGFQIFILSCINNKLRFNLSQCIKPLVPVLDHNNNVVKKTFLITSYKLVGNVFEQVNQVEMTKSFLFGGKRGNKRNIPVPINTILTPIGSGVKLPYFKRYPNEYSIVTGASPNYQVTTNTMLINDPNVLVRKNRCNEVYVKFLNSLGGYSFWLFENCTDEQKSTNLGLINNVFEIDMGSEFEQELELFSKVPKEYMPLMQDLIFSPEIYIYRDQEFNRFYSSGNTIEYLPSKRGQRIKVKLKPFNNYNPKI